MSHRNPLPSRHDGAAPGRAPWPRWLARRLARRLGVLPALMLTVLLGAGPVGAMGVGTESAPPDGAAPGAAEPGASGPGGPGLHVPGEVLVRFRADVGPERRDALLAGLHLGPARSLGGQNAYVVALPPGMSVADGIARLRALPEVEAAEPNRITPREPMPGSPQRPLTPVR